MTIAQSHPIVPLSSLARLEKLEYHAEIKLVLLHLKTASPQNLITKIKILPWGNDVNIKDARLLESAITCLRLDPRLKIQIGGDVNTNIFPILRLRELIQG